MCVACAVSRQIFSKCTSVSLEIFLTLVMCGWSQLRRENAKPSINVCGRTSYSYIMTENTKKHMIRLNEGMGKRADAEYHLGSQACRCVTMFPE